jgi:hypothetical protein
MKVFFPKAKMADIVVQDLGDEALVYDVTTNRAYCLNSISRAIFMASDGATSIDMIAERMAFNMGKPVDKGLVAFGVEELSKEGLISTGAEAVSSLVSRRDSITGAGFASAVALPVVASIAAPSAMNAQLWLANGPQGTTSASCSNGCCRLQGASTICVSGGAPCLSDSDGTKNG